ncbi:terminase gpA endonuclease subunit [Maricaulis maris]|uniref:terminase gpA endonuclease subunit n=1 Tax=Maricaulis maris TaxID=74318 RepID=UPI003B8CFBE8
MMDNPLDTLAHGAAIVFGALSIAMEPSEAMSAADWAEKYRYLGAESGSKHVGKWENSRTPYLVEIMDVCGVDHPAQRVSIRGGAQTAKSEGVANAIYHCISTEPRPILVLLPSQDEFQKWNKVKFQTSVDATPELQKHVKAARSKSEDSSTTAFKRLEGDGFIQLGTASSSKCLQGLPVGYLLMEEVTEYDDDVGGRGDPVEQARARMDGWGDDGKEISVSTPGVKGNCRITQMVEEGDYRQLYVPCPHEECGDYHRFEFERMSEHEGRPVFSCPGCGGIIEEHHKGGMVDKSVWIPTFRSPHPEFPDDPEQENPENPRPPEVIASADLLRWVSADTHLRLTGLPGGRATDGRDPSFSFWQAYSKLGSWSRIWKRWLAAQGIPKKLRSFYQQTLGLPYEEKGDAPDEEALRDAWQVAKLPRGIVPNWACILVGFMDVQADRLEWAAYAFGPNPNFTPGARARCIDHGIIPGDTQDRGVWAEAAKIVQKKFPGERSVDLGFDRFGVDSGYRSSHAYLFAAGFPNVMATKGVADPLAPELGTPTKQTAKDAAGQVLARTLMYPMGQYGLKKRVYFGLKMGMEERAECTQYPGSLEFHEGCDLGFFKQITAEHLNVQKTFKNEPVWDKQKHQANEQLDLAVGSLAMAWNFGIDRMSEIEWRELFAARTRNPDEDILLPMEAIWSSPNPSAQELAVVSEEQPEFEANPLPNSDANNWLAALARANAPTRSDDDH